MCLIIQFPYNAIQMNGVGMTFFCMSMMLLIAGTFGLQIKARQHAQRLARVLTKR
jgi:hypothetical protein